MNVAELQRALHTHRLTALFVSLVALVMLMPASRSTQAADNPIVLENQQPGSSGWMWTKVGDDVTKQIKGYASATSVNQNENITFYVSVNPAQTYTIDFYRFGWYGGMGGRLRLHVGPLDGVQQQPCPMDASTGLSACNWTPSYVLTVPSDWTSGVYAALLTNAQGFQNYVVFVVKDRRPAPFLYQQGINTDQAYNDYPNDGQTGKSLYGFNSYGANTVGGTPAAVKVSFDRPQADSGLGNFHKWEINFIRWLERSGYDVTYSTDLDTHTTGAELLNHKAFLAVGHDEYWSKEMRDAVEAARDAGVNLGFFGANTSYTQVRFEASATGTPNRVIVEYRNVPWAPTDPVQGPTTTTDFRLPPVNRPEQTLLGTMFIGSMANTNYVVSNRSHWVYAGTGFQDGDAVPGLVGYEADGFMSNFPPPNSANWTLLSRSPFQDWSGATIYADSSIYQAPSGAWVFNAGTISWSWGLDDVPGPTAQGRVDARIQRTTANILDAFLNGVVVPTTPTITGFTPSSGPTGSSVTISGTNFTGATAVLFNGITATFNVSSATAIQATVPAGATTGPLTVNTPAGNATSTTNFTIANPPTITGFSPSSGLAGAAVAISGTNLTTATAVTFNGTAATFTVTSDTAIQANVPAAATTGPLSVTTPGGAATSATNFTVLSPPTITGFNPASGAVGASVTISGTDFTGTTAVAFNGTAASFNVMSATTIQTTVPAAATTGPLSVTTPGGTATSNTAFAVAPTITGFNPASGPVGASVTITGTNFTGATAVTFNGVSAAGFTVTSATSIQVGVPAQATTGPLSVTTPAGTATSAASFLVTPTIASFTPTNGPVGTMVTISGTSFTGATAVKFNGLSAPGFTVTSATAIQAAVPAGATTGPLSVTTPGGTATSGSSFAVAPTIASFAPASGAVGTIVTISGANFIGVTAVKFNGLSASGFTVTSAAAIQVAVPTGATTGPLSVTTPGGTATSTANFVVAPTIASFAPASGSVGAVVTISGLNFTGTTAVKFNGVTATNFSVTSPTAIQAIVPTGATTGRLTVTTAAGTATSASNFTVTAVLTVRKTSGPLGLGSGTVTSSPGGINCGPTCSATYNTITVVTLTATPDLASLFNGWTGCDTVADNVCTVTIDKAKSVVVNFLP